VAEWRAEVADPISPAAWQQAVGRLAAPPPRDAGDLLGYLSRDDERHPLVEILHVDGIGSWPAPPTAADLADRQADLDACHAPGWSSAGEDDVSLDIAPDGSVARCEAFAHDDPFDPDRIACLCRALSAARFPEHPFDRRVSLGVMNHPGGSGAPTADGRTVFAQVDSLQSADTGVTRSGLQDVLTPVARCAAATPMAEPLRFSARLGADPTGRIVAVDTSESRDLDPALRSCIETALGGGRASCTSTGDPAELAVTVRAYAVDD
jgi:hypothetical protein